MPVLQAPRRAAIRGLRHAWSQLYELIGRTPFAASDMPDHKSLASAEAGGGFYCPPFKELAAGPADAGNLKLGRGKPPGSARAAVSG